jgi:MYXO-CTERM domain-containing protein
MFMTYQTTGRRRRRFRGACIIRYAARLSLIAGLGALFGVTSASAQAPRFKALAPIDIAVGDDAGPQAVVIADVNRDGNNDIIAIDRDDDAVWVLLGNGDGTFTVPDAPIDLDGTPTGVAVADVGSVLGDRDGNPDIVVSTEDSLEILYGGGDGTFSPGPNFVDDDLFDPTTPIGVAVADFDGNGAQDIAVLDNDNGESIVYFFCNNGGAFSACSTASVDAKGTQPADLIGGTIAAADLDGDGKIDLVVLNEASNTFSPIYGNGNGTFVSPPRPVDGKADSSNQVQSLAVGNLDGNAQTDFVVASAEDFSDLALLAVISNGRDRFDRRPFAAPFSTTIAIALGDVNGDGTVDAVMASIPIDSGQIGPIISLGTGSGNLSDSPQTAGGAERVGAGRAIALGNVGGDSLLDLVQLADDGASVTVCLNITRQATPTGTLPTSTPTVGTPPPSPTVTPTRPTGTSTATATQTPEPTANYGSCAVTVQSNHQFAGVATGLLDGDATVDIAVSDQTASTVYVIRNSTDLQRRLQTCAMTHTGIQTTTGDVIPIPLIGETPGDIGAVDLDGDGDSDLIVSGTDHLVVLWNMGSQVFEQQNVFPTPTPTPGMRPAAFVADVPDPNSPGGRLPLDLNGDGHADIVVAIAGQPQLAILYGGPNHTFAPAAMVNIPEPAVKLAAGDFDGGLVDIAVASASRAFFLRQDRRVSGQSQFSQQTSFFPSATTPFPGATTALASGFFNGDALADVLLAHGSDTGGTSEIYVINGSNLQQSGSYASGALPVAAGVGLFDSADLNADAVVATNGASAKVLKIGLGNGNGGVGRVLEDFPLGNHPPVALAVGYIDTDRMQDIVTANSDGSMVVLLSSVPPPTPTPLPPTVTSTPGPSDTPTATFTPSPEGTPTHTTKPTRTATTIPTGTPKDGTLTLSHCSVDEGANGRPLDVLAGLGVIAALRFLQRRRRGATVAVLALGGAALLAARPAHAFVGCTVPRAELGNHNTTTLHGGAAAQLDSVPGIDLALLYDDAAAIELMNADALRRGMCPNVVTPSNVIVQNGTALALARLDNDLLFDLVVTEQDRDVVLFRNTGNGAFAAFGSKPLNQPIKVAVDDLDRDGAQDLVVGNGTDVVLLRGTGPGTFADPVTLTFSRQTPGAIVAVRIADFTGDALNDIAVMDENRNFEVLVQSPGPTFVPMAVTVLSASPLDMQVGNFNPVDSGTPDVAYVTSGGLRLMLGSWNGTTLTFTDGPSLTVAGARALGLGVFDPLRNTNLDVAVAVDGSPGRVQLFLGDGHGGLTAASDGPFATGPSPNAVIVGDVDGDTFDDIVTTNGGDGSITLLLSSDPSPTATPTETPLPSVTPTGSPTGSPTDTPTWTPTGTTTGTPTATPKDTRTRTPTWTDTPTPGGPITVNGHCTVAPPGGLADTAPLAILGLLWLLRRRASSEGRGEMK